MNALNPLPYKMHICTYTQNLVYNLWGRVNKHFEPQLRNYQGKGAINSWVFFFFYINEVYLLFVSHSYEELLYLRLKAKVSVNKPPGMLSGFPSHIGQPLKYPSWNRI
jgi:hypothetical protein